ncbi:ABC-type hemin transport system substrate-binding protein [Thermocatellispora tengchongensis]|uniref:ABC-type hemin transport system substrate-binding protein n=1 Tax=Thermocatellispora tengchongensis TaxID=1073253 RepID=A0A840PNM3_9ACTN|nr:hypothetical protein [Thermocatellispora tengchongensis]MBB5139300.1 ABC-type hemin transport system substrate-binding protein [Thermocatellispora tengchongensis]
MLLVVDYAETRTGLAALLQQVAADTGRRVRVLLLARSAGEWWQRLGGESAAQDLAEGPLPGGPRARAQRRCVTASAASPT